MNPIRIPHSLARFVRVYETNDPAVPAALFETPAAPAPALSAIRYPLPAAKKDYTVSAKTDGALWLGAANGVTRWALSPAREADRVLYFSAVRYLPDNDVKKIWAPDPAKEEVWVQTETGVSHIRLAEISPEKKAELLTEETRAYVDRRGMVSQKELTVARAPHSAVPHGHSDNSGTFTAGYAVGELCKYAYYKRALGPDDPKTKAAFASAVRATEACQLLMYLPARGDGFVARTYLAPDEPVPDDGLFYRIQGDKAVCLDTSFARERGLVGFEAPFNAALIPARLRHLYTDEGYTEEGLVYKGDTSSDEITHHYLLAYFAHRILAADDPALVELVKTSAVNTLRHILKNGCRLMECDGEPTTWAKWDKDYFSTEIGWSDGCLNAAELLSYIRIAAEITGDPDGEWAAAYKKYAIDEGYAKLSALHDSRFHISAGIHGLEQVEELMYGDNMLATCAYWMLITLEEDPALKELYRAGYRGWNGTFRREHNPAYDFPFALSCPDDPIDGEMLTDWFRRVDVTRVASGVTVTGRQDVAKRVRFGGFLETSHLLPPDELAVTKYDRNPYEYLDAQYSRGPFVLESCYVYTFAYWLGKYYGLIEEDEA